MTGNRGLNLFHLQPKVQKTGHVRVAHRNTFIFSLTRFASSSKKNTPKKEKNVIRTAFRVYAGNETVNAINCRI